METSPGVQGILLLEMLGGQGVKGLEESKTLHAVDEHHAMLKDVPDTK